MAISFLDTILVNSGTGSASTIVAAGARPITLRRCNWKCSNRRK